jgi:uncharacterized SAM-binding protein YcdF (DUF218 family)
VNLALPVYVFIIASGAYFDRFADHAWAWRKVYRPYLSLSSMIACQALRCIGGAHMLFVLSKFLGFFVLPSNAMVVAGLAGLVMMQRKRTARAGRGVVAAALVLLLAFGLLPFGKLLMVPLEERFPPWDAARGTPDGIVVLGGAIDPDVADRPGSGLNEAAERITAAIGLARRYPAAKILYSGGNILPSPGASEARAAAALFESFGIPASRLVLEDQSRTTAENAAFSRLLVMPKPGERWLLVTSAWHMPRAVGAFRKAGFPVEAYPVDYRTPGMARWWMPFSLISIGLRHTDIAMREWFGLPAYWLTGRRSALFPGP